MSFPQIPTLRGLRMLNFLLSKTIHPYFSVLPPALVHLFSTFFLSNIGHKCDNIFKNGPSKICGGQPLKKLKGYGLLKLCIIHCLMQRLGPIWLYDHLLVSQAEDITIQSQLLGQILPDLTSNLDRHVFIMKDY